MDNGVEAVGELSFERCLVAVEVCLCEVNGGGNIKVMEEVSDMEEDRVAILGRSVGVSIIGSEN